MFVPIKLTSIKNIIDLLASFAVLLGVILFFYGDYKTTQRGRYSATYDLYILFQSDDYKDIRYGLLLPWTHYDLS